MGVGLVVGLVSIALTAATIAFSIANAPDQNQDKLLPNSVDDFNVTQAKEGTVVPIIYGKVRTEGNIIWWGNLESEEIIVKSEPAGKGMGGGDSGSSSNGFSYFADVWQGLCFVPSGSVAISTVYQNDSIQAIEAASQTFNDGTGTSFPTEPGEFANKLKGICHLFLKRWYLGDNVSSMPSTHFVAERTLPTIVDFANMSNGNNPAAIIYDLLTAAGVTSAEIDIDSFNEAAAYWNDKGYGLNIKFSSQEDVDSMCNKVMSFVDGALFENNEGKYQIRAFDKDDATDVELDDDDFVEFTLKTPSWDSVHNDFKATYTDQDQDFTKRVVTVTNPAAIEAIGYKKSQTVDLSAYRDGDTASKRLYQVMKVNSFPAKEVQITTHLKWSSLLPGDVISITHGGYGISSAEFRVKSIDIQDLEKNEVQIQAIQMIETLFDDVYTVSSGNHFVAPTTDPIELNHTRIFELPYNNFTGDALALLILAQRENGNETAFSVWISGDEDGDYSRVATLSTFSQRGTLSEAYPETTRKIDNEQGILYASYLEDPEFDTISRQDLFLKQRFAIVGDEIIAFQTVTTESGNIRLKGCIRGVLNTPIQSHSNGTEIWLCTLGNNIIQPNMAETSFFQIQPIFQRKAVDLPLTKTSFQVTSKAKQPYRPGRVLATRLGNDVTVDVWPATPGIVGSGSLPPESYTDFSPFSFMGDFNIDYVTGSTFVEATTYQFTKAGAFDLTVNSRLNGFLSTDYLVSVGASDGTYKGG